MPPPHLPGTLLARSSQFSLNTAGVAGFFGGEEAISAMDTVHLYKWRRWLGWYNSPGSYTIAKRFGRMANTRLWDGLFPGPNDTPAVSLGLDGKEGPRYVAPWSGTAMTTGHLAHLTMEKARRVRSAQWVGREGRATSACSITYLAMRPFVPQTPVNTLPIAGGALYALFPILTSLATCVMCALIYDWLSFSIILLGVLSSGLASAVIGKGELAIRSNFSPARGAPPGHGILIRGNEVVVIKGREEDVNVITKGRFDLMDASRREAQGGEGSAQRDDDDSDNRHHDIGVSSSILLAQFLAQLLLVPQGTFFGQIMFLVSLGVSWLYNSYLSSLEKEKIQANILFETLGNPELRRFRAATRTTMAVFACLLLFHDDELEGSQEDRARRERILNECIPNNIPVWRRLKEKIIEQLVHMDGNLRYLEETKADQAFQGQDGILLRELLEDARAAFAAYLGVRDNLPVDSSRRVAEGQP